MATLPDDKQPAQFALTREVVALLRAAADGHRRLDGTSVSAGRPSAYVEDLLRRDMLAKGLLAPPAVPRAARRRAAPPANRKKKR